MNAPRARCKALTVAGKPCAAAPTSTGFCFFHGNPTKASELGRIGGKLNRRGTPAIVSNFSKLDGCDSAANRLDDLYQGVQTGSIRPAVAMVLMKLTDLQLRVREKTVLEQQISQLQEQLRTLKSMIKIEDFERSMSQVETEEE